MAEPSHIDEMRPIVAERIGDMGHLTQAQSNMLEVLPPDACKGNGVRRLAKSLGIDVEEIMAIGDAENVRPMAYDAPVKAKSQNDNGDLFKVG